MKLKNKSRVKAEQSVLLWSVANDLEKKEGSFQSANNVPQLDLGCGYINVYI